MLDDLDRALLVALLERPRVGLREHARTLGVARGTVQARFERLQEAGVITGFAPRVSPAALGYGVLAFVTLHIAQGRLDTVAEQLASVPEVVEAHSITGDGDLWCRVVAQSNAHLERVIQQLLAAPGVERTQSEDFADRAGAGAGAAPGAGAPPRRRPSAWGVLSPGRVPGVRSASQWAGRGIDIGVGARVPTRPGGAS